MSNLESKFRAGVFAWYGEGSYFRPHWQDLLNSRGISDIDLDPSHKTNNSKLLSLAARDWDECSSNLILMTAGEIPLSLDGFRSLPKATTAVYMTDDEWRFHSVGRYLSLYFDLVVTNTASRVDEYRAHGVSNVIHAPYAANTSVFQPVDGPKIHDAVMIGAAHPDRIALVKHLIMANIPIKVFGSGWNRYTEFSKNWGGFLSTEKMLSVLATAKIVINSGLTINGLPQIKGRIFETAACRTFQITQLIPGLDRYYKPGIEVETYSHLDELVEKTRKYLADEVSRNSIASAAYERTVSEHTWASRLDTIFEAATDLTGSNFEPDIPTVLTIRAGEDYRSDIQNAVESDPETLLTFGQGTGHDDVDRIKLLAFGLQADSHENICMNLASFDLVDKKRRVIANANIKAIAERLPESLPPRSIMLHAGKCLELLPTGEISQETLMTSVVPSLIESGQYRHIDLDTGLFEESASGRFSVRKIFSESVAGLWDVRTKPYARDLVRNFALIDGTKLYLGILSRRNARKNRSA